MRWLKRLAKILATFLTGYGSGLTLLFPMQSLEKWDLSFTSLFVYPCISGFGVTLPQVVKLLNEYGNSKGNN